MIFYGSLKEASMADLEEFCRNWSEGTRVEYADSQEKDLPKAVSSLANTLGGVIVLGIETDGKNMPIFPLAGLRELRGVEDSIINACSNGIYPPITPEVRVIEDEESGKHFALIRVEESFDAPHAVQNKTRIYIRTGSQSRPDIVKLADMDRIGYLLKRRDQPLAMREKILTRIEEKASRLMKVDRGIPMFAFTVGPIFPRRQLASTEELYTYTEGYETQNGPFRRGFQGVYRAMRVPDKDVPRLTQRAYHVEFNQFGILAWRRAEWHERKDPQDSTSLLYGVGLKELTVRGREWLEFAGKLYRHFGYQGPLHIEFEVRCALDRHNKLFLGQPADQHLPYLEGFESDDAVIQAETQLPATAIPDRYGDVIRELMKQIAIAFNVEESVAQDHIDEFVGPRK